MEKESHSTDPRDPVTGIACHALTTSATVDKAYLVWGDDLSGSKQGAGGVGGLLMRQITGGETLYYHYDANGNPARLTGAASSAGTGTYRYDAFGNVRTAAGTLTAENPWQFSTKYHDQETGFSYYGYRYYDPVTGRWPSRDPIGEEGGINLYGMVGNDAVNWWDYLGLRPSPECLAALAEAWRYATQNLIPEIAKYDPVEDGKGGHPIGKHKGGGTTKPGGHYQKIKSFQKGLGKRLAKIIEECSGDDSCGPPRLLVPWPRILDYLTNMPIPKPVIPTVPIPPTPVRPLVPEGLPDPGIRDISFDIIPAGSLPRIGRILRHFLWGNSGSNPERNPAPSPSGQPAHGF